MATCAGGLSEESLKKAKTELNEDPETRQSAVEELKLKISKRESSQDHDLEGVIFERKDDAFLLQFLRARKFDQERSLNLYTNYYRNKRDHPNLFDQFTPQSVERVLSSGIYSVLDTPHTTKQGAKIICIRIAKWNMEEHSFIEVTKAFLLIMEKLLEDEETQINGISVIECFEDVGFVKMCRLAQCEGSFRGLIATLIQDGLPVRFKSAHVVMQPYYITMLMMLVWPFLKEKLKKRIHLHGYDMTSIHEFIDPAHLPFDFQGELASLDSFLASSCLFRLGIEN